MIYFGKYLKDYLEYNNISQTEFATRIGITQKHMNEIINGKTRITLEMAGNIERLTGIKSEFIINVENSRILKENILKQYGNIDNLKKEITIKTTYDKDGNQIKEEQTNATITKASANKIIEIGGASYTSNYKVKVGDKIYVTSDELAVRAEAEEESRKITTLKKDDELKLLEITQNWYKISYQNIIGWVKSECTIYINPNASEEQKQTILETKTKANFELMQKTINRIEFLENGKVTFTYITNQDEKEVNAEPGDHEGLVEVGRDVEGVEVSVFIRQKDNEDKYKVSMRSSNYVNVSDICYIFGGGGHPKAAGCLIQGNIEQVKEKIIKEIRKVLK